MNSLDNADSPLEFVIPPTGDEYLDLAHAKIRVKAQILTSENEAIAATSSVAPVNNFLHSLFSNVQIELNQKCITPQSGLYHYRAMVENVLNFGSDATKSHLSTSMFYKDSAGHMEADENNSGYIKRRGIARRGVFDLESHIHADIFNQNKYMISGVQMGVKFYRAKPEFALIKLATDATNYKIKIHEAVLIIRKLKMNPALLVAHANAMLRHTVKYPITRVEVKNITIPRDIMSTTLDNIFLGQIPQRVIVLFVDSASFNGSMTTNPFNFEHFNHTYLTVATDSSQHQTPLKPNYAANLYISSYNTLFTATGVNFSDSGCTITHDEYASGFNMTVFDLTSDITAHEPHLNAQHSGSLRIEIQFAANLTRAVTAIVFAEFNNLIEISKLREVSCDFSS